MNWGRIKDRGRAGCKFGYRLIKNIKEGDLHVSKENVIKTLIERNLFKMDTVGERSFFLKKKMLTKEKKTPLNAFVFDCYL